VRSDRSPPLPQPPPDALAHSGRVVAAVRARIAAAGGWMPLRDYLQLVLYEPGLGYYVSGTRKFGEAGDFVTAPEISPLFGRALAAQVAAILAAAPGREILELGAGSGRLAIDLLRALDAAGALPAAYRILEVSPDLRERQQAAIASEVPKLAARVHWCDGLPEAVDGAIVANEVLDAVAPDVVVRRAGEWLARGVALGAGDALRIADRPLRDARLRAIAEERFPGGGDYASEVNLAAEALVEDLGRRLRAGALLLLDYGFPRRELYHPQRCEGTLMGHYRHRSHADPFLWPGLSDLTTHVDFTAMAEAGVRAGLAVEGFASQAAFLLGCGLLDRLAECGEPGSKAYVAATAAVNRLVSPAEMGELFKVLALARTPGIAWTGFALGDARHRL
jgi:SAM-dependent MidA family methyltransferase